LPYHWCCAWFMLLLPLPLPLPLLRRQLLIFHLMVLQ
jgi:hypothetical protein